MIITTLLCSCTKEIPIKLNEAAEHLNKPVITALFSTEKNDTVYLDYTYSLSNEKNTHNTLTSKIEISTATKSLGFLNNIDNKFFTLSDEISLKTEETYFLKLIGNENFNLEASFKIPIKKLPYNAYAKYFPSPSGYDTWSFQFTINDDNNTKNFYEIIFLTVSYYDLKDSSRIDIMRSVNRNDPVIENDVDNNNYADTFVFSDELFNGKINNFDISLENSSGILKKVKGKFLSGDGYYLLFRSISEDYYLFKKSLAKHRANQVIIPYTSADIDLDIIFPGEPSELYTNVTGGYGIVAGYQEVIIPFIEK